MKDELVDVRTCLAASRNVRIEIGRDGVLHLLAGPVTLHLDRGCCEELATTLARAVLALAQAEARKPRLSLVNQPNAGATPSLSEGTDVRA